MNKKIRIGLGIFCFAVIIIMGVLVAINHDKWFMSKVTIEYSDGCIEVFEDKVLVTPECIEGRRLLEEQQNPTQGNNYSLLPSIR